MTLSDLDTRYHDMLRELRRWGITESDGRPATATIADRSGETLDPERRPSDTTEQKKAA